MLLNNTDMLRNKVLPYCAIFALGLLFFSTRIHLIQRYGIEMPDKDDWSFGHYLLTTVINGFNFEDLMRPANEHRMVFAKLLGYSLFTANENQWDTILQMVANAGVWALSGLGLLLLGWHHRQTLNFPIFALLVSMIWLVPLTLVNLLWAVQSHNYFMIAFSLLGFWGIAYRPWSWRWCLAIAALFGACMTLAGGIVAVMSLLVVFGYRLVFETALKKDNAVTVIALLAVIAFGLLSAVTLVPAGEARLVATTPLSVITGALKSLAWPYSTLLWAPVFLYAPAFLLAWKIVKNRIPLTPVSIFVFAAAGFIVIQCLVIGYMRHEVSIYGPSPRYYEFLSLSVIANAMAIMLLQVKPYRIAPLLNTGMTVSWLALILLSLPHFWGHIGFQLNNRASTLPTQQENLHRYLTTRDTQHLLTKARRDIPYPVAEDLVKMVDLYQQVHLFSADVQSPKFRSTGIGQGFSVDGFKPNSPDAKGYKGEHVIGSYVTESGGERSVGYYESDVIKPARSYLLIPYRGSLGEDQLNLTFKLQSTGELINITPPRAVEENGEVWQTLYVKEPQQAYTIIAEDNSPTGWFAFAMPRSVGRLSYYSKHLLLYSQRLMKLSVLLLLLALAPYLSSLFRRRNGVAYRI